MEAFYSDVDPIKHIAACHTQASSQSEDDAVGNSLGVHRELTKDIESLPRWLKRVHRKKIETHQKIIEGSRKACRELRRFNHDSEKELQIRHGPKIKLRHRAKVWMMRWELAGSSLGLCRMYQEDH
ncbi:hypothetical protein BHE74_00047268 [Ensete ventricosum]|nr:hypothetical protein BHE74_00047268 [Ensete ventricosum]RZR89309.1 hypothetical protein BHM03_00017001 [Ensete ventricosum]